MSWFQNLEVWQLTALVVSPVLLIVVACGLYFWLRARNANFAMVRKLSGYEDSLLKMVLRGQLEELGARAIPALLWGLKPGSEMYMRQRCALVLARLVALEGVRLLLLTLLTDNDRLVRDAAARGLNKLGAEAAELLRPKLSLACDTLLLQYALAALLHMPEARAALRAEVQQILSSAGTADRNARATSLIAVRLLLTDKVNVEAMVATVQICITSESDPDEVGFAVDVAGLFGLAGKAQLEPMLEQVRDGAEPEKELFRRCKLALVRLNENAVIDAF